MTNDEACPIGDVPRARRAYVCLRVLEAQPSSQTLDQSSPPNLTLLGASRAPAWRHMCGGARAARSMHENTIARTHHRPCVPPV